MINGNAIQFRYATTAGGTRELIANTTNTSLSLNYSMIEVTTEASNTFKQIIPDQRSVTISFDGLSSPMDTIELLSTISVGTLIQFNYGPEGNIRAGEGYISSFDWNGAVDTAAAFSGSIDVTGELGDILVEEFVLMAQDGTNLMAEDGTDLIGNQQQ